MVKFRLPRRKVDAKVTGAVTMRALLAGAASRRGGLSPRILVEFDPVKFEENSRRIRVDFTQKPCAHANRSFNPVC
jgi:hypothetical protein